MSAVIALSILAVALYAGGGFMAGALADEICEARGKPARRGRRALFMALWPVGLALGSIAGRRK